MTTKPLSPARILACILVNLAATPGLGSLWARRRIAGSFQLALALIGFFLIMAWMFKAIMASVAEQMDGSHSAGPPNWMWQWGVIVFGAAWLWSLVTSISLWRNTGPD